MSGRGGSTKDQLVFLLIKYKKRDQRAVEYSLLSGDFSRRSGTMFLERGDCFSSLDDLITHVNKLGEPCKVICESKDGLVADDVVFDSISESEKKVMIERLNRPGVVISAPAQ